MERPNLRRLALSRFDQVLLREIERARPRVRRLQKRYPHATERALGQQLIDRKKAYAGSGGMVSGLFGLIALPADLIFVTWLQIGLVAEIGTLYRVDMKCARGQMEVLEILGRGNGVGPVVRSGPPILARLAVRLLAKKGIPYVGRAVPLVAAPVSAWLNNRDIARVGEEALRHYGTEKRLAAKRKASS